MIRYILKSSRLIQKIIGKVRSIFEVLKDKVEARILIPSIYVAYKPTFSASRPEVNLSYQCTLIYVAIHPPYGTS